MQCRCTGAVRRDDEVQRRADGPPIVERRGEPVGGNGRRTDVADPHESTRRVRFQPRARRSSSISFAPVFTTVRCRPLTCPSASSSCWGRRARRRRRHRNHNGYLLRWDGEGILFDPGEGTQRQFTLAGVSPGRGDADLHHPLPRRPLPRPARDDHAPGARRGPAAGAGALPGERRAVLPAGCALASAGQEHVPGRRSPGVGTPDRPPRRSLHAALRPARASHRHARVAARGARRAAHAARPAGRVGVAGPDVGRLQAAGRLEVDGRTVRLEEVSEPRRGSGRSPS